jgi:benzoyl-CoA 2,3-dioxygenase component B
MPTQADREFVASLIRRVVEPGRYAGWIAPPTHRINKQPLDMEYVRLQ